MTDKTHPKGPSREPTARGMETSKERCDGAHVLREPSVPGYWVLRAAALVLLLTIARPLVAQEPTRELTGLEMATAIEQTLVDVIARCEKSVVAIARVKAGLARPRISSMRLGNRIVLPGRIPRQLMPNGPTDPDFIPQEYGTGVVIDAAGLILTHYHVLGENDDHWVTTTEGKVYRARIQAADPRSGLAVLSIAATDLVPIRFGDASRVRKGQIVIALGNPYAIARDGQASASWGIVANVARKAGPLPSEFFQDDLRLKKPTLHHFGTLIQTDAKLNLGTSGGALVNLRGEMIGLTTSLAALAGYEQAAGYAVPINEAIRRVIDVLKEGREVEHGLLGIRLGGGLSRTLVAGTKQRGVMVRSVMEGTPAYRAKLRSGDFITHIDGQAVEDADALMLKIGQLPAASMIGLRFRRRDRVRDVRVRLAKFPVEGPKFVTKRRPSWRGLHVDYATAVGNEEYMHHLRRREIDPEGCILITQVDEQSPAWRKGLRPKMFISHVENRRVTDPSEFLQAVAGRQGDVRLRLTLPPDKEPVRTIGPGL